MEIIEEKKREKEIQNNVHAVSLHCIYIFFYVVQQKHLFLTSHDELFMLFDSRVFFSLVVRKREDTILGKISLIF